jgi:cytoskeletal protein RodZ
MKTAEQAPQKVISAPTLVVLVAGLGLLGFMLLPPLFAPKEQAAAPSSPGDSQAQPAVSNGPASVKTPASPGTEEASAQTNAAAGGFSGASNRDPFLPSAMILPNPEPQPVKAEPVLPPPVAKTEPAQSAKKAVAVPPASPPEALLAWKGVVGSGPNQVVMVQRNNRTFTVHPGDMVPGTEYILTEISKDSILLISPREQKRLFKKKEVK